MVHSESEVVLGDVVVEVVVDVVVEDVVKGEVVDSSSSQAVHSHWHVQFISLLQTQKDTKIMQNTLLANET